MDLEIRISFIEERNKRVDDCRRKVRKSLGLKKRHDSRKRLIAWMKENTSMTLVRSDDSNSILNKLYDDHMKTEYESFEKAIKSYVIFSDIKIYDLDEAYGNLDFLFGNRKIRQAAYDEILNKIKYKGVKVNTLVIMKSSFIEKLLKKKIKRKLDYYLQNIISLLDDDEGTTDGVRSALTELDRYKTIVEFKYKKYLNQNYLNLLYKKIAVLERELKMRLLIMQEDIYDMEELKGKSR